MKFQLQRALAFYRGQLLWLGALLLRSLLSPNQLRAFSIEVQGSLFDASRKLGVSCDEAFTPFGTTGAIAHFEPRAPADWETKNLPIVLLADEEWDPSNNGIFPSP